MFCVIIFIFKLLLSKSTIEEFYKLSFLTCTLHFFKPTQKLHENEDKTRSPMHAATLQVCLPSICAWSHCVSDWINEARCHVVSQLSSQNACSHKDWAMR